MRVLLDENIPVQLYRRLSDAGHEVEHIIVSGQRGLADSVIRARLGVDGALILLTQDTEFLGLSPAPVGVVIVSRVPQRLPIDLRVAVWFAALERLLHSPPRGGLFELLPAGNIVAWSGTA